MATSERHYAITDADLNNLNNKQWGVGTANDGDLGYKMWGGKDGSGNLTQWLAKDQHIKVNDIYTTDTDHAGTQLVRWYHSAADTDTYIEQLTDRIRINVGGIDILDITEDASDAVVWNEGGTDIDFRIEGVGAVNAFFVQGSSGYVAVGTDSPSTAGLTVDSNSNTECLRLLGADAANEIVDIYLEANGALSISAVNSNDSSPFIGLLPKDDNYGLVLYESDGTGVTAYANFYVVDDTDDYLSINVSGTTDADAFNITASDKVGFGTASPSAIVEIYRSSAHPILMITGAHNADYDPQIQFRTDGTPTIKSKLMVDATDDVSYYDYDVANATGKSFVFQANGSDKFTIADSDVTLANGLGLNVYEDVTFLGATTENQIKFPDNLADALSFQEGANEYMKFVSTDSSEAIEMSKSLTMNSPALIGVGRAPASTYAIDIYGSAGGSSTRRLRVVQLASHAELALQCFSDTSGHYGFFNVQKSHNDSEVNTTTIDNEVLGGFNFTGMTTNNTGYGAALIRAVQDGNSTATKVPGEIEIQVAYSGGRRTGMKIRADLSVELAYDNQKLKFGAGLNTEMYYDASDFIIDTDANGSGSCKINGLEIDKDGFILPITSADADAPNNSIYYSSTASKLVYKDSGGTVNNLY